MKRKILALVLACLMIVSAVPVSAVDAGSEPVINCPGQGYDHYLTNCDATFIESVPASCGEDAYGYDLYKCNGCGDHFANITSEPEAAHNWVVVEGQEGKEPTCTEPGVSAGKKCSYCGDYVAPAEIAALGHDYENYNPQNPKNLVKEIVEGNCENGKVINWSCRLCDWTHVEESAATGHNWSARPILDKAPTEKEKGLCHYICLNDGCDAKWEVEIMPTGAHTMEAVEKLDPTCLEDGREACWYCADCGGYYGDAEGVLYYGDELEAVPTIDALGHDHEGNEKVVGTEATCEGTGSYTLLCNRCEQDIEYTTDALGHKKVVVAVKDATCTEQGLKAEKCEVCDETLSVEWIPALNHDAAPADGYTYEGKGEYYSAATCAVEGGRAWLCSKCGELQKETFEAGCDYKTITIPGTCGNEALTITYCTRKDACDNEENTLWKLDYVRGEIYKKDFYFFVYQLTAEGEDTLVFDYLKENRADIDAIFGMISIKEIVIGEKNPEYHVLNREYLDDNQVSCTESRKYIDICLYCHDFKSEVKVQPALDHDLIVDFNHPDFADYSECVTEQTCTTDAVYTLHCTREGCEYTEKKIVEEDGEQLLATGHRYSETADRVNASTCINVNGTEEYDCLNGCGHTEIVDLDAFVGQDIYPSVGAAQADHPKVNEDEFTYFYQGDCITNTVYHYECPDCGDNIIVEIEGSHTLAHIFANDPTCTEPGNKEAWCCIICLKIFADAECEEIVESFDDLAIPALDHDVIEVEAKDPTCKEAGNTAGWYCGREGCDASEGMEPIAAIAHKNIYIYGQNDADCLNFGYVHHLCPDCDWTYMDNYVAALGHNAVEDAEQAPSCTEPGLTAGSHCDREGCGVILVPQEEIPATGHWAYGPDGEEKFPLIDSCMNIVPCFVERICGDCGEEIGMSHDYDEIEVAATCKEYGYTLYLCLDCGDHYVEEVDDKYLADHTPGTPIVVKPATHTEPGYEEIYCDVCDKFLEGREIPVLVGIVYSLTVDNAVRPGFGYSDGSVISVTVKLSGTEMGWWGMEFDVDYDESAMEFLADETQFYTESGAEITYTNNAIEVDGKIHIISVHNSVDVEDDFVNGDQTLVTLKFLVNNPEAREASFSVENIDVINGNGDVVKCEYADEEEDDVIEIRPFMDPNGDGKVTLSDLQLLYAICSGDADVVYDVTVDTNRDGKLNVLDIYEMFDYMSNNRDPELYEEIVGRG